MADDPTLTKYLGKFIDVETGEPVDDDGLPVEFYMEAMPNTLLIDGGLIDKANPEVKQIRRLEAEKLALLRADHPFTEEEPAPPPKDAPPAAQRAYQESHAEWDERRKQHDADLKEQATILRDHHEHKEIFIVAKAGRPVFTDREFIRINIPGDNTLKIERQVRQEDIEKHRKQYALWKSGQAQTKVGTSLESIGVSKAQAKELAYFGVLSVENLAKVSDANLATMGPYTALRKKAQDYLATAKGMAPIEEARKEAAAAREEVAELKKQMAELLRSRPEMEERKKRAG